MPAASAPVDAPPETPDAIQVEPDAGDPPPEMRELRLRTAEVEFIPRLAPLLPTPRAGKKLVNLYRLIRNGIDDGALVAFLGDPVHGGAYQAVLVLLAIIVGRPGSGGVLLAGIGRAGEDAADIVEVIRRLATGTAGDAPVEQRAALGAIADAVAQIAPKGTAGRNTAHYRTWMPAVARLSFYTQSLFTAPP